MGTPHSEGIIKSSFKRKCRLLDRSLLWSRFQVGSAGCRCMSLHTGVSPSGLRHGTLTPICAGSNPATPAIAARWGSPREIITRWIHNPAQQARRWPALGIPQGHRLKTLYPQCPRRTRHNAAVWARKRDSRHAAIYDGAAFTGILCCETAKWSLMNSHHIPCA